MAKRTSKDVGCVFPYRQIHFDSRGNFGPCCQFTDRRNFENIHSITEYLNSVQLEDIKIKLNRGERISSCQFCWNQEKTEIPSMRQKTQGADISKIREVFITFGNQCNTACRICNASRSSLVDKYNKQHVKQTTDLEFKKFLSTQIHNWKRGKVWYKNIAEEVSDIVEDLELIQVSGGEPFINAHFDDFINTLINSGKTLPKIRITTNGSFTEKQIKKLEKFSSVEILFSVDGFSKEYYEYLRWPLKHSDLIKKINILKSIKYDIQVNFQLVMHNLNLSHIHDAIRYFQDNIEDDKRISMTFTLLNGAEWYSLHNSPKRLRNKEIEKLKKIDWNEKVRPDKQKIIEYLEQDFEYKKLSMLVKHVEYTDSYRGTNTWEFLGWHPSEL